MAELNKELWLAELKEAFSAEDSFLTEARDLSALVEYDKIYLAEAGAKPQVYDETQSYPLPITTRTDTHIALELKERKTGVTRVGHAEIVELSYDKLQSVMSGHKQALKEHIAQYAAYHYAPKSDSLQTPIIATSGVDVDGLKKFTFDDVLKLRTLFNKDNVPQAGRVLVLSPDHEADLINEDRKLYKSVLDTKNLYDFKVFTYNDLPYYSSVSGAKLGEKASKTAAHYRASLAFQKDEVMRAIGTMDMFYKEKDPEFQADTVSFYVRFLAIPIRERGIASIYSKKST